MIALTVYSAKHEATDFFEFVKFSACSSLFPNCPAGYRCDTTVNQCCERFLNFRHFHYLDNSFPLKLLKTFRSIDEQRLQKRRFHKRMLVFFMNFRTSKTSIVFKHYFNVNFCATYCNQNSASVCVLGGCQAGYQCDTTNNLCCEFHTYVHWSGRPSIGSFKHQKQNSRVKSTHFRCFKFQQQWVVLSHFKNDLLYWGIPIGRINNILDK